jgi:hypothetical protein
MADNQDSPQVAEGIATGDATPEEPRIMCYVSKEMVPMSSTIEVEYEAGKSFRVLPKYVKYE